MTWPFGAQVRDDLAATADRPLRRRAASGLRRKADRLEPIPTASSRDRAATPDPVPTHPPPRLRLGRGTAVLVVTLSAGTARPHRVATRPVRLPPSQGSWTGSASAELLGCDPATARLHN